MYAPPPPPPLLSCSQRGAIDVLDHGVPDAAALAKWKEALNSATDLPTDRLALAKLFASAGDGVLLRLRVHVQNDNGHLAEQLDRNTGATRAPSLLPWDLTLSQGSKCQPRT
jgi:hypothetical protein